MQRPEYHSRTVSHDLLQMLTRWQGKREAMQRERSLNISLGQVTGPYRHLNQFDLNPEGNRKLLEEFTWENGRKSLWFEDDDSSFPAGNDQVFHNGVGEGRVASAVTVAVGKDMAVILLSVGRASCSQVCTVGWRVHQGEDQIWGRVTNIGR